MVSTILGNAVTGMVARETDIAIISHNLANINTNGFRKQVAEFQDLIYQVQSRPGNFSTEDGSVYSGGISIGLGTKLSNTYTEQTQGELVQTSNMYAVAISGTLTSRGFFKLDLPDGSVAYTRDGSFTLSPTRELVNTSGFIVSPGIIVPLGTSSYQVNTNGEIYVQLNNDTITPPQLIGTLDIIDFANPSGLQPLGTNLYVETPASGAPIPGVAGKEGFGGILQNYIESSNVSPVEELTNLISAQRGYELCSNIIKAADEMMQAVSRLSQ